MDITSLEKYREQIKDVTKGDDFVVEMILFETGRTEGITTLGKYPILFHGILAIITNCLYPLMGLKRSIRTNKNEDFIFISCPDPVFRTKTIGLITGELKYFIIYLPNFRVPAALNYHKFFNATGTRVYFPTIKLRYVMEAKRKLAYFKKLCGGLERSIECQKLLSVLSSYLMYDCLMKDILGKTKGFKGKWILEHDKFYFIPTVANLHLRRAETTMLQHGVFFRTSFNYFPMFCDKVLCCSEREKRIYAENGVAENRVEVLGAPLQTLQISDEVNRGSKQYDMLVMMTMIKKENVDLIREVLSYIKQNYNSVLLRMRPRSRKEDEALLGDVLDGLSLNTPGSSIMEDLAICDKVVSFSEDANVEIAKLRKPFIYVWNEGERDLKSMGNCATADNFKVEIRKLMEQDFYSTFNKEQYNEILGETDINVLQKRFEGFINERV